MSDLPYWILALVFLFAFPPVGVLMIALRLFGGGKRRVARGRHPYYMQRDGQAPVGPGPLSVSRHGARKDRPEGEKAPGRESGTGYVPGVPGRSGEDGQAGPEADPGGRDHYGGLRLHGAGLPGRCVLLAPPRRRDLVLGPAAERHPPCSASWAAVPACCGPACGKKKQVRTYRNYLAMIGRRQTISISTLASATGASPAKVRDCLEDMLDDGLFPLGFLDYGGDRLVLSGEGAERPGPGAGGKDGGEEGCPGGRGERGAGRDPGGERLHRRRGPLGADRPHRGHHRQDLRVSEEPPGKVCPAPCLSELLPAHNPEDPPGLCPAGVPGRRGGRTLPPP